MTFINRIAKIVSGNLFTTEADKIYASLDQSTNVSASLPQCVVQVKSIEELIAVVRLCLDERVAIVMRGAGSGKSGGAVAEKNSVVIDTRWLNRIISIDKQNLFCEVEPGVVLANLQQAVAAEGLYYPVDPASAKICTLGGNVAENAAGPSTLKYGTTRDYLLGGQAILGTGDIIDFGKRCPKGVTGFDIASLLCGSEGTLAIFTKLRLRLLPLPQSQSAAVFFFGEEEKALLAVNYILNHGHWPKTLEYVDQTCLQALSQKTDFSCPTQAQAALIVECDASYPQGANEQIAAILADLKSHFTLWPLVARTDAERQLLWQKRCLLSEACTKWLGHKLSEDVAVPLGAISSFGIKVRQLSQPPHIICALFGHAGDGNLHVQIMFDDLIYKKPAQEIRHKILLLALELGGTLTAEHGIGLQKKDYLCLEQSPSLMDLQRRIKHAFDPHNLLNPGKIFDA